MNPFRRPLIAGNWKMNMGGRDACELANAVAKRTRINDRVDVVVAPPFTAIAAVAHEVEEVRGSIDVAEGFGVGIAAQNLHAKSSGAFTGEVSAPMLRDAGATWVIIGHSERRQLFGETDEGVAEKTKAALEADLRPIVCVGETLAEREAGQTLAVVERQLRAFMGLLATSPGVGVVAYEPVWAIGTGRVASPQDAQQVHGRIRELLAEVSEELAEATCVLYGGSVKADNAAGLLGEADIDGALVGGASLDAEGFGGIADAAQRLALALAEESEAESEPDAAPEAIEAEHEVDLSPAAFAGEADLSPETFDTAEAEQDAYSAAANDEGEGAPEVAASEAAPAEQAGPADQADEQAPDDEQADDDAAPAEQAADDDADDDDDDDDADDDDDDDADDDDADDDDDDADDDDDDELATEVIPSDEPKKK